MNPVTCPACQSTLSPPADGTWWCPRCKESLASLVTSARSVLLVSLDHIPGRQITEVLGLVAGVDAHGATTFNLSIHNRMDHLVQATQELVLRAYLLGANAVVGAQFMTHGESHTGVTCYGTAVRVE